jgi:hypothetical protein
MRCPRRCAQAPLSAQQCPHPAIDRGKPQADQAHSGDVFDLKALAEKRYTEQDGADGNEKGLTPLLLLAKVSR